jgi:ABC-type transporter Mla subunit MlaD
VGETQRASLERGIATLELRLDRSVGRLPADTSVQVRSQGLLGAKYVDVKPGRSVRTLPSGSVIAPARSSTATTLSDLLQALDGPRRSALRDMLRGLGGGLAGRGARLNEGLEDVPRGLRNFSLTVEPVVRAHTLPELVRAADSGVGAVDPVRGDLAATFDPAERALRPLAQERASVERLLATAPAALAGTRRALADSDPLLTRAERFAHAASGLTAVAPRALDSLTDLLRGGRRPLGDARQVLLTAQAAVPPTLRLTRALHPVLPRVRSFFELTRQPARVLGDYGCDIARWGRAWHSMLGFAARGQEGPLGPLTILRTTLATGGVPGVPDSTPGAGVAGDVKPCEPDRGPQ